MTDADGIFCFGKYPYICHGYLGSELVAREGYPRHALVCERHTGAGLSLKAIMERDLPVPHREMIPISLEEQIICFADKFYSKTKLDKEKSVEKARKSIESMGKRGWHVLMPGVNSFVELKYIKRKALTFICRIMLTFAPHIA